MNINAENNNATTITTQPISSHQEALETIGCLVGCWYGCNVSTFPCAPLVCSLVGSKVGGCIYSIITPNTYIIRSHPLSLSGRNIANTHLTTDKNATTVDVINTIRTAVERTTPQMETEKKDV